MPNSRVKMLSISETFNPKRLLTSAKERPRMRLQLSNGTTTATRTKFGSLNQYGDYLGSITYEIFLNLIHD